MYAFKNKEDMQALIDNAVDVHSELEYKLCLGNTDKECKNSVNQPCCWRIKIGEQSLLKMLVAWQM